MAKAAYMGVATLSSLDSLAEGSIVQINESGSPVDFYVAKHNYESGLNGTGRTLLVRKDCYDSRAWHSSDVNAYATSAIDTWLNGDYKALLDTNIQEAIGATVFYYTPGKGNTTVTTLSRSVFLLSVTEYGLTTYAANTEGSALPTASTLRIAKMDGSATVHWTRTPYYSSNPNAFLLLADGTVSNHGCTGAFGSRPCFTLPADLGVSNGLITGVAAGTKDVARKVKKLYVGLDGIAHKVKKAYIGDAINKARLWWSSNPNALVCTSNYGFIHYSTDGGKTWTTISDYVGIGDTKNALPNFCFNEKFYTITSEYTKNGTKANVNLVTSEDGANWVSTVITYQSGPQGMGIFSYDNIVIASIHSVLSSGTVNSYLYRSTDGGKTFTNVANRIFRRIAHGNGVLVGRDNSSSTQYLYYSTDDGVSWTQTKVTSSSSYTVSDVVFDGSKFVASAVYNNERTRTSYYTSTNGTTWATVSGSTSGSNYGYCPMYYYNGQYVRGTNTVRQITYSTDLSTWTTATIGSDSNANYISGIVFDGTKYKALTRSSDGNVYEATSLAGPWTMLTDAVKSGGSDFTGLTYSITEAEVR